MTAIRNICVIPARSRSKGVLDKNIQLYRGKSLLDSTVEAARAVDLFDAVLVTSDSKEYLNRFADDHLLFKVLRPDHLSSDDAGDGPVIDHALSTIRSIDSSFRCGLYVTYLRPTTPSRSIKEIRSAVKLFDHESVHYSSLVSVEFLIEPPEKYWLFDGDLDSCINFQTKEPVGLPASRQIFGSKAFRPNGVIEIFSASEDPRIKVTYGNKVLPFLTRRHVEVDRYDDLGFIREQLDGT